MERAIKKVVRIGNKLIGGTNPILIQSMTNTDTKDIKNTVKQILALEALGCDIIRVSVKDLEDAYALKEIKKEIHIPLVADIHYDLNLAIEAIKSGVDKVRLNPGNTKDMSQLEELVSHAKENQVSIRVGVNSGSLPSDLKKTKEGMIEAAKRQIVLLENLGFNDIVLSFKSSDVNLMIDANKLASETFNYPLHIGLTEAGVKEIGLIKSSIAIGYLLLNGIGDTIRVSLTADPIEEVKAAKEILRNLGIINDGPLFTSCPTCGRTEYDMIPIANKVYEYLNQTNKNVHVAVMGCVVNGLGEAKDADIAIVGSKKEILVYQNNILINKIPNLAESKEEKNITANNVVLELKKLIENY